MCGSARWCLGFTPVNVVGWPIDRSVFSNVCLSSRLMAYVPLHERKLPLDYSVSPGYASPPPRMDPSEPSRKRRREETPSNGGAAPRSRTTAPPSIDETSIAPSVFGVAPRNEVTRVVGDFLMNYCRGVDHVEIEVKLGTIYSQQQPDRRFQVMAMNETILPPDVPIGKFGSTMRKENYATLNALLNSTVEGSVHSPTPLRYERVQQVDSFYAGRGGKVRVSRDLRGNVIPSGVVQKRRLADLHVSSPRERFDFRISANVEEPADIPEGEATGVREKNRACYRHQVCQVDLTAVTARVSCGLCLLMSGWQWSTESLVRVRD